MSADQEPFRADVQDRTGQPLRITAGTRNGAGVFTMRRPGHPPLIEFTSTRQQLDELDDLVRAVRRALDGPPRS